MEYAWVISAGTELTLGQTPDTNAAWLAARLAALGIRPVRHVVVPDDLAAMCAVLREAAAACDVILMSGGLGPTADDLTRQAVAEVAGVPLELHAPSLEHLRAFFAARGRELPASNTVQALVPRGATALPNACGTAPGLHVALAPRGIPCFCLPGVPFEMRAMFEAEVAPRLSVAQRGAVILTRRLHTFGLGESVIGERIRDLMERGRNPEVGTTAGFGIVGIRINATAVSVEAATTLLDGAEAELRQRLGAAIFGRDDETLALVVGELLVRAGRTLSTAESCTGGLLGALLTEVAGSSRYYLGGAITYANELKTGVLGVAPADLARHGAVSAEVAGGMAAGAARAFGSDYALSLTGIAGPGGATTEKPIGLVFIGLRTPETDFTRSTVREFRFGDAPRQAIRLRAAWTALDLLRRALAPDDATTAPAPLRT